MRSTPRGEPHEYLGIRKEMKTSRHHLADARGWLDERDAFFKTMSQIVQDRLQHQPRCVGKKNRTGATFPLTNLWNGS